MLDNCVIIMDFLENYSQSSFFLGMRYRDEVGTAHPYRIHVVRMACRHSAVAMDTTYLLTRDSCSVDRLPHERPSDTAWNSSGNSRKRVRAPWPGRIQDEATQIVSGRIPENGMSNLQTGNDRDAPVLFRLSSLDDCFSSLEDSQASLESFQMLVSLLQAGYLW